MPLLGAHMSIAGGYYKAVEAAAKLGMETCQIFSKNNNQWRAKEITPDEAKLFRTALEQSQVRQPLAHSSYLINLAAPDDALWQKSIAGMVVELQRAATLGIRWVVMHPGAFTTSDEATGIARVAAALDAIHRELPRCSAGILLENTAGQGSTLGWKFEQLADILGRVKQSARLGVCFDTCHALAAGYPLTARKDYLATWRAFADVIGMERLHAIHVNDSKKGLGSRVDRHEHIGQGQLGLDAFRHLVNDKKLAQIPMYLETEKGENEDGEDWDAVNLRVLRSLVK